RPLSRLVYDSVLRHTGTEIHTLGGNVQGRSGSRVAASPDVRVLPNRSFQIVRCHRGFYVVYASLRAAVAAVPCSRGTYPVRACPRAFGDLHADSSSMSHHLARYRDISRRLTDRRMRA